MQEKSKEDAFPLPVVPNPSLTSGEETESLLVLSAGKLLGNRANKPDVRGTFIKVRVFACELSLLSSTAFLLAVNQAMCLCV